MKANTFSLNIDSDYAKALQAYMDTLDKRKVKSLDELIQWNKDHADVELPPRMRPS
jgi:amidase